MIKRAQNRYAEGRLTLPLTLFYGLAVWLLASILLPQSLWLSGCCMAITVFAMAKLNDYNLLIRIYSRSVSSVYIVLICAGPFLFSSLQGAFLQLCFIASLFCLFQAYQNQEAVGKIFYGFACLSLGSIIDARLLYYVPFFWFIMLTYIYSMSKKTFAASLLGVVAPYWFIVSIDFLLTKGDITPWINHLSALSDIQFPNDYTIIPIPYILLLLFVIICYMIGAVHFLRKKSDDKIRVRQIFYCFILTTAYTCILTALQPSLYDMSIRLMIITVSPLIAHFYTLTYTKFTNIAFFLLSGTAVALTIVNLWILSLAS